MSDKAINKATERSFMATMVAIAWSFIGLRRRKDFDEDVAGGMNPLYVVVGALMGAAIFVATLIFFVKLAVS
ncbi:DUF2970 domain-containing protein [Noviherbaspirillum saxi]|uniref:DUF2970 domain-containing protein n=1 Tax=Noviherbaspirillum saxi TaxID=2320863 RepID=A0A3A3G4P2_9BURK|nr:DUF2970 domain-containing protein [Noviherbaspirillum saxi]RJF95160.1 DUF2970 domain-containing protein [Noviherbaspirillum saxi]